MNRRDFAREFGTSHCCYADERGRGASQYLIRIIADIVGLWLFGFDLTDDVLSEWLCVPAERLTENVVE